MTPGARLANDGRKEVIDEMVTDLFQKMAAGKVTWPTTFFSVHVFSTLTQCIYDGGMVEVWLYT